MSRVFIVEDDLSTLRLYETLLQPKHEILAVGSGSELRGKLREFKADLIILDVELGTYKDGFDLAAELRKIDEFRQIPILFVTAKNAPDALQQAFDLGAEDYLTKPFQPFELLARVEHRIQKSKNAFEQNRYLCFESLKLDLLKQTCVESGASIELAPAEFQVLLFLVKNSGRVVARKELSGFALGERELSPRLIDTYVSALRKKLPLLKNRIESIYAVGYCLKDETCDSSKALAKKGEGSNAQSGSY